MRVIPSPLLFQFLSNYVNFEAHKQLESNERILIEMVVPQHKVTYLCASF